MIEALVNPWKFDEASELTEEKLETALSEAIKKIDKGLENFGDSFPAEASVNHVYEKIDNTGVGSLRFYADLRI